MPGLGARVVYSPHALKPAAGTLVILCRMASDLVPICLSVTAGDLYTLWAPRWREGGDEWEAFLGEGDDLYGFASAADLAAFVRGGAPNDLTDHPAWQKLTEATAHRLDPDDDHRFDLVGVEELLAGKPEPEAVQKVANALAIVSSIGTVCELPSVTKFFNGNPTLSTVNGGSGEFAGKAGGKRWSAIAAIVGRSWDGVLAAVEEVLVTPDVDAALSARAAAELEEPAPEEPEELAAALLDEDPDVSVNDASLDYDHDGLPGVTVSSSTGTGALGGDVDFWEKVGIDPIRMMTDSGGFYTLRCYFNDRPIFLGRNGRISVFPSERALARYLADEHDHDLADLSTYEDIRTAATDGSLNVRVNEENVYVLTGLGDDIADGPDAVDHDQLELAVELLRDAADYAEDDTVDRALAGDRPLGALVGYVLDGTGARPAGPYADASADFEKLERFLESRLRREA